MIQTSRIVSGFDVELQLGAGWFLTAFRALNDNGLLLPDGPPPPFQPDAMVSVDAVTIADNSTNHDLVAEVTIGAVPLTVLISLELSDDGTELVISSNIPNSEPITVPFDALSGLAGPPRLRKLSGNAGHDACIAFLANLDLRASPQDEEPLPAGEHLPRGTELAVSFLPAGQDIAIGISEDTFPRIANDIWHTALRAADGTHPFPDADDVQGTWQSVSADSRDGHIRITLRAHAPVTGPDADVTITIDLTPAVKEGLVGFDVFVDSDVDTGILGSLFAFFVGGVLGFLLGLFLGRSLTAGIVGAGVGSIGAVIYVELKEAAKEREIKRRLTAMLEGEDVPPVFACHDGVVTEAEPGEGDGGMIAAFVNAIPRSIPVGSSQPDPLHVRTVVVEANYDELQVDGGGLAFAGSAAQGLRFQPLQADLVDRIRDNGELRSLVYRTPGGEDVDIPLDTVFERMADAELRAPYKVQQFPFGSDPRIPAGRLPSICLTVNGVRRRNKVVREIRFTNGLDLAVPEAVALQDAGAIILRGLQLIHPRNANPYFRAPANDEFSDNVESQPPF